MELIREIIYPTENNYMLRLLDEMIGKQVEVIAFEIEKTPKKVVSDKMERLSKSLDNLKIDLKDVQDIFKDNRVNLSNFKFDRDEANNYEDFEK